MVVEATALPLGTGQSCVESDSTTPPARSAPPNVNVRPVPRRGAYDWAGRLLPPVATKLMQSPSLRTRRSPASRRSCTPPGRRAGRRGAGERDPVGPGGAPAVVPRGDAATRRPGRPARTGTTPCAHADDRAPVGDCPVKPLPRYRSHTTSVSGSPAARAGRRRPDHHVGQGARSCASARPTLSAMHVRRAPRRLSSSRYLSPRRRRNPRLTLAKLMGTSVGMIERHYGTLLDGASAGIAGRSTRRRAPDRPPPDVLASSSPRARARRHPPKPRNTGPSGGFLLVEPAGIEPATSCLQSRRSPS